MKTFETSMQDKVYVDDNNYITKIDFRENWSMNIKLNKEGEMYIEDCFFSNLLTEFKISQPRDFEELDEIVKKLWKEWDMKERGYVYEHCVDEYKVGNGFQPEGDFDYYSCTSPVLTFTIKGNEH